MPIVLKSGSLILLEPSGPLQACNGIALPFYPHWHKFLQVMFCYCSYTWVVQLIIEQYSIWIPPSSPGSGSSGSSSVFFGVTIAKEIERAGDRGWGSTTRLMYRHPWGTCSWDLPVFLSWRFCLVKTKLLALGLLSSSEGLSGFPEFECPIKMVLQHLFTFLNFDYVLSLVAISLCVAFTLWEVYFCLMMFSQTAFKECVIFIIWKEGFSFFTNH